MQEKDVFGCDVLEGDSLGSVSEERQEPLQDRSTNAKALEMMMWSTVSQAAFKSNRVTFLKSKRHKQSDLLKIGCIQHVRYNLH